jgi:LPPG:FO 2-phospho-L-lactate transferase
MKIVVLAGGVGAARFLEGLVKVVTPSDITVIVNTGDDEDFYNLRVCPDIDTIIYTLSGNHNDKQGWGLKEETYTVGSQLKKLGNDTWFMLGDKDIATHIHRTSLLKKGNTLSEVTKNLATHFSIPFSILPMSNDSVKTMVKTPAGVLPFQEYFVKRRFEDTVISVEFKGVEKATPAPGVIEAIDQADAIIIAPSNPIVSIGTILSVSPIREHIKQAHAKKIAISPLVGGKAIKGPAARMFQDLKLNASVYGIAKYYEEKDKAKKEEIEKIGIKVVATNTLMTDITAKTELAKTVINSLDL